MSAFTECQDIGQQGLERLLPLIQAKSHKGQFVVTSKGPLAPYLQKSVGDVLLNTDSETLYSIEVKTERENKTGNFFLETWSNKNLRNRSSHAQLGSTLGWMLTLRADLLFYYFLENDDVYIINFLNLKRWAFGNNEHQGKIYSHPEKQTTCDQLNDTWGRCVPISEIRKEVGFRHIHLPQLELELNNKVRGLGVAYGELSQNALLSKAPYHL